MYLKYVNIVFCVRNYIYKFFKAILFLYSFISLYFYLLGYVIVIILRKAII